MTKKQYSPEFKFRVVVEIIKSGSQIQSARKYNVDYRLVSKWYKAFTKNGHQVFSNSVDKRIKFLETKVKQLEQIIGKKEIESMFLKNFLETSPLGD